MNQLLMETVREEQREHVVPPTDIAIERNETSRFLLIEFYVVMHKILSLIILLAVVVWNLISARLSTRRINRNYSSEPGCVLFIALGDSIDLVLSAPIIESFRSKFPECKIRIVVRSNLVNFIKGNPFFDAVIPFEFCAVHNWQRMTRGHAQWWYNAFAIPHSLLESISTVITLGWKRDAVHAASAAVMHRVGILNIIGFRDDGTGVVQRILNFFIDHGPLRSSVRNDKDAINILLQDLNLLDRDPVACVRKCFFSVQSMPRVNEFLRTVSGTVVALAPGGETELQCWPLDYYVELGNWIIKEYGASIIILGELSDRIRCQDLYLRLDGDQKAVFAGELRLHEIFEIMPLLSLVCGNENIFYHTSVFSGTPSVSMFGPGVFNCMDSATRKHQVVRQGLSCSPCSNNCLFNKPICMEGISVESVKRAVSYSLDRSSILSINTS